MYDKIFIIHAPPYTNKSAGVHSLYKLAFDLKKRGFLTFVTLWDPVAITYPVFDVPVVPNIIAFELAQLYNAVIVYPETSVKNPLNAKNVIRWVMNKPGCLEAGEKIFDKNEKIVMYGKAFNQSIDKENIDQIVGELTTPTIDIDLFKYDNSIQKTDITVYTGKQSFKEGYVQHYDNLITRTSPSREEVSKILQRTKVLYSFDCVTGLANEARFCGCEVVLIPNSEQSIDIENNEFGMYGLHEFGKDELKYDYDNIQSSVMSHYSSALSTYEKQLDEFIEIYE